MWSDYQKNTVLRLWYTGLDTQEMAVAMGINQSLVERILHRVLDERCKRVGDMRKRIDDTVDGAMNEEKKDQ